MTKLSLIVLASGLMVASGLQAQTASDKDLPSAPSATLQEQMRRQQPPPPPPAPAPQQPPAAPAAQSQQQAAAPPSASTANAADPDQTALSPATKPTDVGGNEPNDNAPYVFKVGVDEVNVIFTVTDKHGKFVKDLKQSDFKVLDNSKEAKQIRAFHTETDLPLRVGLLVDASNSVRDRFTFEQESAIEFLNQIIRPKFDRAFVIGFDTTAEVTQDFTDDTEKLSKGVRSLRAGGGTALYDALFYACRDKLMKSGQNSPTAVRRAVILLSDGEDNQSRVTREEAIEMAQRAEVIVYAISTNVSGVKLHGDKVLERMADATGGRAFFPFKVQDVATAFAEIQDELRSQYQLAYKPADFRPDGSYHSIEILAENHKNLKVRARKGYYAPKQ